MWPPSLSVTGLARRLGAYRRRRSVGLWYHPTYAARGRGADAQIAHVVADRGERIIGQLLQEKLIRPVDVRTPPRASIGQLRGFHSQSWLERATRAEDVGRVFGLEPDAVDLDAMLEASRLAVGGTISAAHEAARRRLEVAVNLGGGFHHAEPELGSGFCVFNDVGVAIADLRKAGFDGKIGIIDLDYHQGNGNTAAFADDPSVLVASIHGAVWSHIEASAGREIHLSGPVNDRRYVDTLVHQLLPDLKRFRPKLVFYIAGADVLAGDPLGTFGLTLEGVFERDRRVFELVEAVRAPVVVTMAGGYGPLAWRSHHQLVRAALTGVWQFEGRAPPSLRARYARVAARLDPAELQGQRRGSDALDLGLTEADVMGALRRGASDRYLGYYSASGVELAFETYGLYDKIRARGFGRLRLAGDPSDQSRQRLEVYGTKGGVEYRLLELVLRRMYIPDPSGRESRLEVLFIEWLLLQDPTARFRLSRPPLPGQEHPGLGIARELQEILFQACRRLGLAALMDRPSHFHNAAYCEGEWRFLDPEVEGRFRAIRAIFATSELYEATWAVERGELELGDGTPVPWLPGDHVLPVSPHLSAWLEAARYRAAVRCEKARLLRAGLRTRSEG